MRTQNRQLEVERCRYEEALKENKENKEKLEKYKSIELAVKGLDEDLNQFLEQRGAFDKKTKDISILVIALKKSLAEVRIERNHFERRLLEEVGKHEMVKRKLKDLQVQLAQSECNNNSLLEDIKMFKEREQNERPISVSSADDKPRVSASTQPPATQPSSPPLSSGYKLPSFKLMGYTKRSITPKSDDDVDERSPLMPIFDRSRKQTEHSSISRYLLLESLYILLIESLF